MLAGPTCDSIDVIAENLMLPALKAGDLIVGRAMGAYTWASASEFNFFPKATVVSVNRRPAIRSVMPLPFETAGVAGACRPCAACVLPGASPARRRLWRTTPRHERTSIDPPGMIHAALGGHRLRRRRRIIFAVVEDSRCPIGATCVQDARVQLMRIQRGLASLDAQRISSSITRSDLRQRRFDDYVIELRGLEPYPRWPKPSHRCLRVPCSYDHPPPVTARYVNEPALDTSSLLQDRHARQRRVSRLRDSHQGEAVSETPGRNATWSCTTRTPAKPCSVVYRRGDEYDTRAIAKPAPVMRDHRNGESARHRPGALRPAPRPGAGGAGCEPRFEIISGYRSPESNAKMAAASSGVAKNHCTCRDAPSTMRLHGCSCADLRDLALAAAKGGVGYYARFVIDTAVPHLRLTGRHSAP